MTFNLVGILEECVGSKAILFFVFKQLWDVRSANERKSINVKRFFLSSEDPPEDVEVIVKCCSWSADGDKIIVAAKNKVLVSPAKSCHLNPLHSDTKFQPLLCVCCPVPPPPVQLSSVIWRRLPNCSQFLEALLSGDMGGLVRKGHSHASQK
jgi:hypothetical protein